MVIEFAEQYVADINAIAIGLAMTLDGMEGELGQDVRFYALRACIDKIVEKSEQAAEAIEMCEVSQQEAGEK